MAIRTHRTVEVHKHLVIGFAKHKSIIWTHSLSHKK